MEVIFNIEKRVEEVSLGYSLSIESTLQRGFNIFRKAPAEFIIFSVLAALILSNPLSGLLLGGVVMGSYFHMSHMASRDLQIEIPDFFRGFDKAAKLILLGLLVCLIIFLGLVLLILPGIYFTISYVFTPLFVWFYDKKPSEALRLSRLTVSGNFGQIFLLLLILAGINVLGLLAMGMGILLTLPFSYCVIYAAFDDIIGISN